MPTPDLYLSLYVVLVVIGLFLLAAEVIIPGGILGVVGGMCLVGAVVIGFVRFQVAGGFVSLIAILGITTVFMIGWLRIFPHTYIGRKMTLTGAIHGDPANPDQHNLVGQAGEAITDLRPGGLARIDGNRIDVVAHTGWIDKGTPVKVIEVEGIRVVVREA